VSHTASRWAKPAAGLLVTAAFVWLLLRNVDLRGLASSFGNLPPTYLLLAVAFLAAGYAVRIVRWWWMLRALDPALPLSACVWPFLGSIAVNNTVPFRAGDALRVVAFRAQLQAPPSRVLGTLVLERLLDLFVLLAFFFAALLGLPPGAFPGRFIVAAAWLAGGSLVAVSALILLGPWVPLLVRALASRPGFAARGWSEPICRFGLALADALNLLRAPARLAALLGLSVLTWMLEGAVFATVARCFATGATDAGPWFALATATLATSLPSSPGHVGTFDYFAVLGLMAYGATREAAVAFAVTVHALLWLPLTALGLGYLLLRGKGLWRRSVARSAEWR
jgi:uncharacterized membrane protein YbhN (UPF0104 family)